MRACYVEVAEHTAISADATEHAATRTPNILMSEARRATSAYIAAYRQQKNLLYITYMYTIVQHKPVH